jgi:hypothetical protein
VGSAKKMRHFSSRPISSTGSFLGVMSQLRNGICPPDLFKFMRGHRSILFSNSYITAFDKIHPARACVIDIYRKIESCLVPTSLFHHPFVVTMLHNTFSNWEIGFFCGKKLASRSMTCATGTRFLLRTRTNNSLLRIRRKIFKSACASGPCRNRCVTGQKIFFMETSIKIVFFLFIRNLLIAFQVKYYWKILETRELCFPFYSSSLS